MTFVTTQCRPHIGRHEMTGELLAASKERVIANTKHGRVVGGRITNGCQVFLNVPYAVDVLRWEDPQPLPQDYRYPDKEYVVDGLYCAQPSREYTQQVPVRDRLGLGKPTENPFFADIYVPSVVNLPDSGTTSARRPVRVFIHGGFLQFGSTSGQSYNQQFFAAEHFGEVRVLLGHRVSVLGFLGSDNPPIAGNFGFKDCWLGLEWVRDNIAAFGGDPGQIHLSGLSGGAHIVHQLLHRAALCAPSKAPFVTALLQSNAILTDPFPPSERSDQFSAFCKALGADPLSSTILDELRDTDKYPTPRLIDAVQRMSSLSTFRAVVGPDGWVLPDQMAYQASGRLGRNLQRAGVHCIIVGDVRDEDWFYHVVHDCPTPDSLLPNVARYYPLPLASALLQAYPPLPATASREVCQRRLGRVLADGQVHLPVRLLASDLAATGLPVVRYTIEAVAQNLGTNGRVPHSCDLAFQHLRMSVLTPREVEIALGWHDAIDQEVTPALRHDGSFRQQPQDQVLLMSKTGETAWTHDWRLNDLQEQENAVNALQRPTE